MSLFYPFNGSFNPSAQFPIDSSLGSNEFLKVHLKLVQRKYKQARKYYEISRTFLDLKMVVTLRLEEGKFLTASFLFDI